MTKRILTLFACTLFAASLAPANETTPRLEVLFLGDNREHKPLERYRILKQVVGTRGVNVTFADTLDTITKDYLNHFDALVVYANYDNDALPDAIIPWVRAGGGLIALHHASACFRDSDEWAALIGARLDKHEGHEFSPKTVDDDHPVTRNLPVLQAWDESYQHKNIANDIHLLQVREPINAGETEPEPWTWTRNEGDGRVFYTASGHDLQVWSETAYLELLHQALLWVIGDTRAQAFATLKLPELQLYKPELENRAHPDIPMMELQKPLSPADSALHTQVPVGTRLTLFASEPMVINPISIDWDERGRAWIVESFGYPNDVPKEGKGTDRIKILEDTTGDGKADKMTVFADGLRHGTTSVFANGGIVITDGTEIVFLKDTTGDDKADVREVLANGLRIWDTHASTSNFHYGLDNWIYATVGYSGVDMRLHGEHYEFGASVFRFRPDLSEFEQLQRTTNNTWGLGITEDGDIMGSTANNNPSWIMSNPIRLFKGTEIEFGHTPRADTNTFIYPNTFDITQVDQIDRYTAAASHGFYTDNLLEGIFAPNHAFITEPTGHLVGLGIVEDRDSLKVTHFRGNNIFASADAWSSPVVARTGPDGSVWIVDWYNAIIQHNVVFRFWNPARGYDYPHSPYHVGERGPGSGNAYITPLRDREHGRIWRIVPATGDPRTPATLDIKQPASLLQALHSPSQHTRLHAQRLLVELGNDAAIPHLIKLITEGTKAEGSDKPLTAVHAIWTIEGLGGLDNPGSEAHNTVSALLSVDADPLLRRHALQALGANDPSVINALPGLLANIDHPRERLFLLQTAAETGSNEPIAKALWELASSNVHFDGPQHEATRLAMRRQGTALLGAAFANIETMPDGWRGEELEFLTTRIANSPQRPALIALITEAPDAIKSHVEEILAKAEPADQIAEPELPEHLVAGYNAYMKACIECHQADGAGVPGTFPPIADTEWVKGHPNTLLRIILGGAYGPIEVNGVEYNNVMPGHSHASDEELAAIASYVRFAFANKDEDPIDPERVKALRPELEERKFTPYTAEELIKKAKDN